MQCLTKQQMLGQQRLAAQSRPARQQRRLTAAAATAQRRQPQQEQLPVQQQQPQQHIQQEVPVMLQQQQQQYQQEQKQQPSSSGGGRRGALAALGAAALSLGLSAGLTAPPAARAAADSSTPSHMAALEEYMRLEDANKLKDLKSLESVRNKHGMRRGVDGRVQLRRRSNGSWVSVRLDMEVPGAILLRDTKSGEVFALETDGLPQVDLSDDYVVLMLFGDGSWEKDMTPIEVEQEGGKGAAPLTMAEKEFREFVGLLKEPEAEPAKGGSGKKR